MSDPIAQAAQVIQFGMELPSPNGTLESVLEGRLPETAVAFVGKKGPPEAEWKLGNELAARSGGPASVAERYDDSLAGARGHGA